LAGDEQADHRYHGGPEKAVYAYAAEDLDWWSAQLERRIEPGFIGENLTTRGLDLNALHPGDELHCGELILRVTEPREPCAKLGARIGVRGFEKRFGRAGRTGVYCAVIEPATIRVGTAISVVVAPAAGPSIRELVAAKFGSDAV
jgi:MOSC domain-containing protein YiiM